MESVAALLMCDVAREASLSDLKVNRRRLPAADESDQLLLLQQRLKKLRAGYAVESVTLKAWENLRGGEKTSLGHKDGRDARMRITCALSNSTSSM